MSAYIEQLKLRTQQSKTERAAAKAAAEAEKTKERLVPLEVRVLRLLAELPDDQKLAGLSMGLIRPLLRGRRRGNAPPGHIGTALTKLGWVRYRHQSRNGPTFVRWFPPGTPLDEIRSRCKAVALALAAE
jgi:hypothetical protein